MVILAVGHILQAISLSSVNEGISTNPVNQSTGDMPSYAKSIWSKFMNLNVCRLMYEPCLPKVVVVWLLTNLPSTMEGLRFS